MNDPWNKLSWKEPPAKGEPVNGALWGFPPGTTLEVDGKPFKRPDGLLEIRFKLLPPTDEPVIVAKGGE